MLTKCNRCGVKSSQPHGDGCHACLQGTMKMPTQIKWDKRSNWYMESDCGNYTLTKANASTQPIYCGWFKQKALLVDNDPGKAKKACQDHKDNEK